ncbi:class II aldolase/adducin domain-containing protein [Suillus subaureus]|uniref:Class II aldolase/adducin domain-containing protein n=1 Tax=Suillus subaureus TaxID=48587 RepID=A0A9P7JC44_9AGAM|nr:class II aldolase/adducin domain-containing protein [Suillus subaureus]KAG1813665.1 class II aldolase/adducin domain-containing protein [Suillus subaureus]
MTALSRDANNISTRIEKDYPNDIPPPPIFSDPLEHRSFLKFRLAQAYRIFAKYGYDEGVAGHITVRDPIRPDCYWVNPWGVHFKLIQPELLLLVDHEGEIQEKESGPSRYLNRAAYMIHSAVHEARPDIICAAHSHTKYAKAFSTLGVLLDPITQDSCAFYEDHSLYSEFRGIVEDREEGLAIATALGPNKAVILQNHGILVATKSIESTIFFFISMEKCCKVQMLADRAAAARGLKPRLIDPENAADTHKQLGSDMGGWFDGLPEFQLLEHEEGKRFEYIPVKKENM